MRCDLRKLSLDIKIWTKHWPDAPDLENMRQQHKELKHKIALKEQTIDMKIFTAKSKHSLK
jgi:hypothetical protein